MITQKNMIRFGLLLLMINLMGRVQAHRIIPAPLSVEERSGHFEWNAQTKWHTNLDEKQRMSEYLAIVFPSTKEASRKNNTNMLELTISPLPWSTNKEAYQLKVSPNKIVITANTETGLFYGIQTLLQLSSTSTIRSKIPCLEIKDEPRFSYRGFMLDVSRHFFSKSFILKLLDTLSYYKINKFHFHLADTGGWRFEINSYPLLTELTSYRPVSDLGQWWGMRNIFCKKDTKNSYGGFYTQDDIREIVDYATARHIEVIPEIDMPGHNNEVLFAYPQLACEGKDHFSSGELCIGNENSFVFCRKVLEEVMDLFPSEYIHIGGDEANRSVWQSCSLCRKRMKDEEIETVAGLQNYFTNRMKHFLQSHGKTIIGWNEMMDGDISNEAIIMSWKPGANSGVEALRRGHKVILTPNSHCYLDYYQDNPHFEPKALGGYTPLEQTYGFEPTLDGTINESLVLGIQGNLWTEYVMDEAHAEYMTFPRMLAIAEIGWTTTQLKSYPDFHARALNAVEYLKTKGMNPFTLKSEIGMRPDAKEQVHHLAMGKEVKYLTPYNKGFAASKEKTLTDGILGDWNTNGARWQGFRGNMDVIVDLGETTTIHSIKAHFMQVPTFGVFTPEKILIEISNNGKDYDLLFEKTITMNDEIHFDILQHGWVGNLDARYVRYHATRDISWGNIVCDEIIVK